MQDWIVDFNHLKKIVAEVSSHKKFYQQPMSFYFRTPLQGDDESISSTASGSKRRKTTPGLAWTRTGPGAQFLIRKFEDWAAGNRATRISPSITDADQILTIFDDSDILSKHKRPCFPRNFLSTANNFNIEREKSGGRAIGNARKGLFYNLFFTL